MMSEYQRILVPLVSANDEFCTLIELPLANGTKVSAGEVIAIVENEKTTVEVEVNTDGYFYYAIEEGDKLKVGEILGLLSDSQDVPSSNHFFINNNNYVSDDDFLGHVKVSAKARRMMSSKGLTEKDFPGFESIRVRDVVEKLGVSNIEAAESLNISYEPLPKSLSENTVVEQNLTKKTEGEWLRQSHLRTAPSTLTVEIDGAKSEKSLLALQKDSKGLSLTEWIAYVASGFLSEFPSLNGFFYNGKAYHYSEVNLGVAMGHGKELLVPVFPKATKMKLKEFSLSLKDISLKVAMNKVPPENLKKPTFTVTSLASLGVTHVVPVIGPYQSSILGICAKKQYGFFNLVMAYDHQMSNGFEVAHYLGAIKKKLEEPQA